MLPVTINHDAPYAALYTLLQTRLAAQVKTFGRRLRPAREVSAEEQPALFLAVGNQSPSYSEPGLTPPDWRLEASIWIYARNTDGDRTVGPGIQLNALITAAEAALFRQDTDTNHPLARNTNLGGLVDKLWIEHVETDEGLFGDQAEAVLRVVMLVPAL